jgi:uncharacterized protein (DUF1697 family)
MTTYIALLYSIVLTPRKRVVMADLRAMAERVGLKNVRTHASSGNLVFEAAGTTPSELEGRLERAFPETFGRHVDIIVRDAAAWRKLAAANPFPEESERMPDQVALRVMRAPVPADTEERLRQAMSAGEQFAIVNGDPWIVFSRSTPNSRLLAAMNHKRLGVGTSRNWNTVRALAQMVNS